MCFLGYLLFSLSVRGRERARLDARSIATSRQPRSRFLSFPSLRCSHKKCFNKTNKLQKLQFNTVWIYLTLFWTVSKCYFFCFCFVLIVKNWTFAVIYDLYYLDFFIPFSLTAVKIFRGNSCFIQLLQQNIETRAPSVIFGAHLTCSFYKTMAVSRKAYSLFCFIMPDVTDVL